MGREIRRVPPDWQHPQQECKHSPWAGGCSEALASGGKCLRPLHNSTYAEARQNWLAGLAAHKPEEHDGRDYWEWEGGPPNREYYRPDWPADTATAYQMYETVSEGTPVSPVFGTEDEMIAWLVAQGRSPHAATEFVRTGWAPSMVIAGGRMASNVDVYDILPAK